MKIVKKILLGIVALIVVLLVIGIFSRKDYRLHRDIIIAKPKQEVFDYVKMLKNETQYNVWAMKDPAAKIEYKGTDGTPGFIYYWNSQSDEVGEGEQEITKVIDGESVASDLRFVRPFEGKAYTQVSTEATGSNQTKVTWFFQSSMAYPMNVMLLFMDMEGMLGKDLEKSLVNLKANLEK